MTTAPIRHVLVVGGGTAGWMTAVYLNRAFGDRLGITVVESDTVPTIGVGEATFNTIKGFFDFVGLDEQVWMPACNATFKMAIKFVDWAQPGQHFYHPFQRAPDVYGVPLPEWWLKSARDQRPFDHSCFNVAALCDAGRAPCDSDGRVFDEVATNNLYAYHFDAALLAEFLRRVARDRGVERVGADVVGVSLDESGAISSVELDGGRSLSADMFVDATGFRALLINQALGEPFESYGRSLLCDRAVALRVPPNRSQSAINPYTTATARQSGWVWDIPLAERVGAGYVYSSQFAGADDAEADLRGWLDGQAADADAIHLRMRIGRCRNSWVKNCVAIGLSSGFVEPLESTGIFFIQHALVELVNHLPDCDFDPIVIRSYNDVIAHCLDGVRDFLVLHYIMSPRQDTDFWRAARSKVEIPPELAARLELWQRRLPTPSTVNPYFHGFASYSYWVMMLGLGGGERAPTPLVHYFDDRTAAAVFLAIQERSRELISSLPSHRDYLEQLYSRPLP